MTEADQAVDRRRGVPVGLVAAIAIGAVMAVTGEAPGVRDDSDRTHPCRATVTRPPGRPSHFGSDLRRLTEILDGKTPVRYNYGFPAGSG